MNRSEIVYISPKKFFAGCLASSLAVLVLGRFYSIPPWVVAAEVFITVITLFIFGSIRYRVDKNVLTYSAVFIVSATFWNGWWSGSFLRQSVQQEGAGAFFRFVKHHFLTLHGLNHLFHADTMLFILGLTLFVAVIAQTRLLETISFALLKKNKGFVVSTVAMIAALVSFLSGILDGVSMIGLMIRTLVIILFLAKIKKQAILYAVMISTVMTTVCGMWLAYGEPPNLIMKANLHPYLDDMFFLKYCLPIAIGSYVIVAWNIRRQLGGKRVQIDQLDILDRHTADVRFLQASRHGKVLIPTEFIDDYTGLLAPHFDSINKRLHNGETLGAAMVREGVPEDVRKALLGKFVLEEISEALDDHYVHVVRENNEGLDRSAKKIDAILASARSQRIRTQVIGGVSFIPFIGLLVGHAVNHDIPLFLASFAGFAVALIGIVHFPNIRRLSLHEAKHEYAEYLFLLPLFFSINLLQKTGFFDQIAQLLDYGIRQLGVSHVAYIQYAGTTFLSAILDNNVVADFAGRALLGLDEGLLKLFAMAQIAGYAVGGCWTHIGSAQSVVAYAFVRKEVDSHFTPFQWIRTMTPIIFEIFILVTAMIYLQGFLFK